MPATSTHAWFGDADWLLTTPLAVSLYHGHAEELPVVDFHNHLDARALADDRTYDDVTALWVATDPYKHRLMRMAGVPERLVTGDASPRGQFEAFASALPLAAGNPVHAWTALELERYFGVTEPLTPESAGRVFDACNDRLRGMSARSIFARYDVRLAVTSETPDADLSAHEALRDSGVVPSLRVDDASHHVDAVTLDRFHALGCRVADHGIDDFRYEPGTPASDGLVALAAEYVRRGWVLLLHLGALRHTSRRLRRVAGPQGGYATVGPRVRVDHLVRLLSDLEEADALPRTVIFPLDPNDYEPVANLAGSFTGDGVRGHVQLGPAWWYNDHDAAIRRQLDAVAAHGLLGAGVGMTTDSRSLLSLARHEYFRRIFCDWLGRKAAAGLMPDDEAQLAPVVRAVCFDNAHTCFAP